MKKVIIIISIFLISGTIFAQKVKDMKAGVYADSLKTGQKSIIVRASNPYDYFTVMAYTVSDTDTVRIKTSPRLVTGLGLNKYSTKAVINLQTNAYDSIMVVTPTPKEWTINDPEMITAKLIKLNDLGKTVYFIISGKRSRGIK